MMMFETIPSQGSESGNGYTDTQYKSIAAAHPNARIELFAEKKKQRRHIKSLPKHWKGWTQWHKFDPSSHYAFRIVENGSHKKRTTELGTTVFHRAGLSINLWAKNCRCSSAVMFVNSFSILSAAHPLRIPGAGPLQGSVLSYFE